MSARSEEAKRIWAKLCEVDAYISSRQKEGKLTKDEFASAKRESEKLRAEYNKLTGLYSDPMNPAMNEQIANAQLLREDRPDSEPLERDQINSLPAWAKKFI